MEWEHCQKGQFMKMIKPRLSKLAAVAAMVGVCVVGWGFQANAALTNLALHKTVTVSGSEAGLLPSSVTDGDTLTRWGSAWTDSQWAYIDFGAATTFDSIAIWWEHSNAVEYMIQTANTATSNDQGWTTLFHPTNDYDTINNDNSLSIKRYFKLATPSNVRYLKIRCIKREYQWGYSIHELMVFNTASTPISYSATSPRTSSNLNFTSSSSGVSIKFDGASGFSSDVFGPNGQLVRHLSGADASFWNYKDAMGHSVTNGTYLLRVTSAGKTIQEKIAVYR